MAAARPSRPTTCLRRCSRVAPEAARKHQDGAAGLWHPVRIVAVAEPAHRHDLVRVFAESDGLDPRAGGHSNVLAGQSGRGAAIAAVYGGERTGYLAPLEPKREAMFVELYRLPVGVSQRSVRRGVFSGAHHPRVSASGGGYAS